MTTDEIRSRIIEVAKHEIGVTENPAGSNITKFNQWFGFSPAEWCGIFCSWVYAQADCSLGHPKFKTDFYKGFASVPFAVNLWSDHRTQNPKPGDLVTFDWDKDNSPDHVGLFLAWMDKAAGLFQTIEGNTSTSNNSNGGQVQIRQRNMANVHCFINLIG